MSRELLVRYRDGYPVGDAEIMGREERVHITLDKLFQRGAKVKDSWNVAGGRMFLLEIDFELEVVERPRSAGCPN